MNTLQICKRIAILFFSIGTLLLVLHYIKPSESILLIGYNYVILALFINSIILIMLIVALIINKQKIEVLKSIGVILLNIPIAFVYFQMVIDSL